MEHTAMGAGLLSLESIEKKLGDHLLMDGTIDSVQLNYINQIKLVEKKHIGHLFVDFGVVGEKQVARKLAELWGFDFVDPENIPLPDPDLIRLFNKELCIALNFLPLSRENDHLKVLVAATEPSSVQQIILSKLGLRCLYLQSTFSAFKKIVNDAFSTVKSNLNLLLGRELKKIEADTDHNLSPAALLTYLLAWAVHERATDVHISPSANSIHVLFRIDGVLRPMFAMNKNLQRLIGFIKLRSEMDISEQRLPQDGSFRENILEVQHTLRVSTIAAEFGERVVMRLLPEAHDIVGLQELGYFDEDVMTLVKHMHRPSGLILITGPTGSGKSSTLHAGLRLQHLIERNVLTVEEPLEYRVPGAGQTEVNRKAGYDFVVALKHFLRHDPDVILLGEMRDPETARVATDAAATGHLVLSTLHVTTALGVVSRLLPMGLEPQVIAENLLVIVNQRLVRKICTACKKPARFSSLEREWLGVGEEIWGFRGEGCEKCGHTGFSGRLPVYEILEVNEAIANAIADEKGREELRRIAYESGFKDMEESAKKRVLLGQTTAQETWRMAGVGVDR